MSCKVQTLGGVADHTKWPCRRSHLQSDDRTGCGCHGSVLNWVHQLPLNPAFCKSHTSCSQKRDYILLEYSGGKQTCILNFCDGVHFQHFQNHALYRMLGLGHHICASNAISTTLNRTPWFHSWLVCYFPNPFSLNWFGHNEF